MKSMKKPNPEEVVNQLLKAHPDEQLSDQEKEARAKFVTRCASLGKVIYTYIQMKRPDLKKLKWQEISALKQTVSHQGWANHNIEQLIIRYKP